MLVDYTYARTSFLAWVALYDEDIVVDGEEEEHPYARVYESDHHTCKLSFHRGIRCRGFSTFTTANNVWMTRTKGEIGKKKVSPLVFRGARKQVWL